MQLSKKQKPFSRLFSEFLKCRPNFKQFEKKMPLIVYVFSKIRTTKYVVR